MRGIVIHKAEYVAIFVAENADTITLLECALQLVGTGIAAQLLAAELIIEAEVAIDVPGVGPYSVRRAAVVLSATGVEHEYIVDKAVVVVVETREIETGVLFRNHVAGINHELIAATVGVTVAAGRAIVGQTLGQGHRADDYNVGREHAVRLGLEVFAGTSRGTVEVIALLCQQVFECLGVVFGLEFDILKINKQHEHVWRPGGRIVAHEAVGAEGLCLGPCHTASGGSALGHTAHGRCIEALEKPQLASRTHTGILGQHMAVDQFIIFYNGITHRAVVGRHKHIAVGTGIIAGMLIAAHTDFHTAAIRVLVSVEPGLGRYRVGTNGKRGYCRQ